MGLAPNRVDWRWAKAADASEYTDSQALYRLQGADDATVSAYRFRRAMDRGLPFDEWQSVADAYELATNLPHERVYVEGLLLGGDPNSARIAHKICATADVIEAYHDVFFDIRSRRESEGWIAARLFQGQLYGRVTPLDTTGMMHRIAWLGGYPLFESYYTGKYDETLKTAIMERMHDMMAKQALLNTMCLGHGAGEHNLEMVRIFVDHTQKQLEAAIGATTGDKTFAESVMGFLQSVPLKVADPTDPANLNLPAREPRAHEILSEALKP